MILYCIVTVETNEKGETIIKWLQRLHIFKEDAFEEALKIGPTSYVIELHQLECWNYDQMYLHKTQKSEIHFGPSPWDK